MNSTLKFIFVVVAIVMIAAPATAQKGGDSTSSTCEPIPWLVVANGYSSADTAVASSLASNNEASLVYVTQDHVPEATLKHVDNQFDARKGGPVPTYIVGGQDVVSDDVIQELQKVAPITPDDTVRLGGADRFETAAMAAGIEPPCKVVPQEGTYGK